MQFPEHTITALLGQSCGDAFGQPFEYHAEAPTFAEQSLREGRYLDAHKDCGASLVRSRTAGLYTDDTQQALVLLFAWKSLTDRDRPRDATMVGGLFSRICKQMSTTPTPGHTFGLHRGTGQNFRDAVASGVAPDTAGLGAAMRIGPVATLLSRFNVVPWTITVSGATTRNSMAQTAAAMFAQVAQRDGVFALNTPNGLAPELKSTWGTLLEAREALAAGGPDSLVAYASQHTTEKLSGPASGFALTGVPWVLWAVESATDFPDALRRAASMGGDADTVCAMAGCLAALRFGRDAIPTWMLDGLVGKEHLLNPSTWHPIQTERKMAALDHELRTRLAGSNQKGK